MGITHVPTTASHPPHSAITAATYTDPDTAVVPSSIHSAQKEALHG